MLDAQLRKEAARLLADKEVDLFIGYGPGSLPLRSTPVFARRPEDVMALFFDPTCENNLALYLPRHSGVRVGVVAKPCDARALVELLREHQVDRSRVHVVGVPCRGVISRRRLAAHLGHRQYTSGRVDGDTVVVAGDGWEEAVPLVAVLHEACPGCRPPVPELFDVVLGEAGTTGEAVDALADWEALDPDTRYARFEAEMSKCLRCYACRQACPACYCPVCFVDRNQPAWVGVADDVTDAMVFHLVRSMHVAGRCVDCGACVRACPQGIDLRLLNKRLERDAAELFGFQAGVSPDHQTLPGAARPDDPDHFVK